MNQDHWKTYKKGCCSCVYVGGEGTWDVGRNEMVKGLHQVINFVKNHNQTNVIMMSLPCRYDLEPKLCVNDEVKVYNRKLKNT
jgi:hypothetical protein